MLRRVPPTIPIVIFAFACATLTAQRPDLNPQFHGYATQAYIKSTGNNWDTTNSTGPGSFRWTEGVGSVTAAPFSRMRIGAQARVFLLGAYGPKVTLDWASIEFKANEHFGIRAGKVKSAGGLYNETQDIDPAFVWTILPQSVYPLASRNGNLAVSGGLIFGTIPLGERFGKIEYHAFGGRRALAGDDGYFDGARSAGITFVDGTLGSAVGGSLTWHTPGSGLLIGAAYDHDDLSGKILLGPLQGKVYVNPTTTILYTRYEHNKLMMAGEYSHKPLTVDLRLVGLPAPVLVMQDERNFYVMTTYKLIRKLTAGAYYSSTIDSEMPLGPSRYQKDWTVSSRYDVSSFLYLKLEQHFLDGTHVGFSLSNNPQGLQETSRLTFAKLGVTF